MVSKPLPISDEPHPANALVVVEVAPLVPLDAAGAESVSELATVEEVADGSGGLSAVCAAELAVEEVTQVDNRELTFLPMAARLVAPVLIDEISVEVDDTDWSGCGIVDAAEDEPDTELVAVLLLW
jgi:hypothetical protein